MNPQSPNPQNTNEVVTNAANAAQNLVTAAPPSTPAGPASGNSNPQKLNLKLPLIILGVAAIITGLFFGRFGNSKANGDETFEAVFIILAILDSRKLRKKQLPDLSRTSLTFTTLITGLGFPFAWLWYFIVLRNKPEDKRKPYNGIAWKSLIVAVVCLVAGAVAGVALKPNNALSMEVWANHNKIALNADGQAVAQDLSNVSTDLSESTASGNGAGMQACQQLLTDVGKLQGLPTMPDAVAQQDLSDAITNSNRYADDCISILDGDNSTATQNDAVNANNKVNTALNNFHTEMQKDGLQ